jgi:hypothetical protein
VSVQTKEIEVYQKKYTSEHTSKEKVPFYLILSEIDRIIAKTS